jgi:hypothetical protein
MCGYAEKTSCITFYAVASNIGDYYASDKDAGIQLFAQRAPMLVRLQYSALKTLVDVARMTTFD